MTMTMWKVWVWLRAPLSTRLLTAVAIWLNLFLFQLLAQGERQWNLSRYAQPRALRDASLLEQRMHRITTALLLFAARVVPPAGSQVLSGSGPSGTVWHVHGERNLNAKLCDFVVW